MELLPPERDEKKWELVDDKKAKKTGTCKSCNRQIAFGQPRKMWRNTKTRRTVYTHIGSDCDL